MKLFDFEVPEQIVQEAVNCVKRIDNKTILENITKYNCSKGLGGIRPIPTNLPLIRKKLEELVKSDNAARLVWIQDGALYGKFTVVLSEKALIDGFEALENTFGTAPILLAMLLDERESIREFAQKKCEQIPVWKIAPQSQEEAQAAFKETFAPFIGEMSHLLNPPEIKEVVREVKSELPPAEANELSELRKEVKALRKVQSDAYSFANELNQQQEKTARLEQEKASILEKDRELRQENKQLKISIDRLTHENAKLIERISYLEEKVDAIRQSKHDQQERYETRLKQVNKSVFDESYIQETKKLEKERNPAAEFFAAYTQNGFFKENTKAALIIDGHNVLNKDYYQSLDLSHEEKRTMLARALSKLLDFLPNLRIYLYFDSSNESANNFGNERLIIKYSGGIGEHRADREIKNEYGHLLLAEEKVIFLVTDDNDIRDYCFEADIISSDDLIRLIK